MSVQGFDYRNGQAISTSRECWQQLLDIVLATGGSRRVEKGETFAHDAQGVLCFEVYANISAPVADVSDLL